jgi:hypothetical protein
MLNRNPVDAQTKELSASVYRTRWLIAHNCLHALVHGGTTDRRALQRAWQSYLAELRTSDEIAKRPA